MDLCVPPEICSEILTGVPIKSILRFRSVCKSWLSHISSPNFKLEALSDQILLNRTEPKSDAWSLTSHDVSFSESRDLGDDLPDRFRGLRLDPIGSCDGLICFFNYREDRSKKEHINISSLFIYNPAIRKIVELPSLTFGLTHRPHCCGFGFDSKASDYKVMLILSVDSEHWIEVNTSFVGFVFDLRNGAWREFTPILPKYLRPMRFCPEFYVNDVVHWFGRDFEFFIFIVSFNLSNETFRVISMPAEINRNCSMIMTSGGLVYALAGGGGEISDPRCSVWVMKEYGVAKSWTKVFTLDMPPQFCPANVYLLIFRGPEVARVVLSNYPREALVYIEQWVSRNNESGESSGQYGFLQGEPGFNVTVNRLRSASVVKSDLLPFLHKSMFLGDKFIF